jgi:hypothetical protein
VRQLIDKRQADAGRVDQPDGPPLGSGMPLGSHLSACRMSLHTGGAHRRQSAAGRHLRAASKFSMTDKLIPVGCIGMLDRLLVAARAPTAFCLLASGRNNRRFLTPELTRAERAARKLHRRR